LLGQRDDLPDALLEQRVEQQLLVREAPVHGADADAGEPCDLVQRDAQAAVREPLAGGLQDALPVALGVSSHVPSMTKRRTHLQFRATVPISKLRTHLHFTRRQTMEPQQHSRRWWILALLGLAQLMVVLDATIVNIALPSAQHDLGFSNDARQWIVTGYAL